VNSDGSENTSATSKKQCKKAGGKWQKLRAGGASSTATQPK
jgi:hypothetical protein